MKCPACDKENILWSEDSKITVCPSCPYLYRKVQDAGHWYQFKAGKYTVLVGLNEPVESRIMYLVPYLDNSFVWDDDKPEFITDYTACEDAQVFYRCYYVSKAIKPTTIEYNITKIIKMLEIMK